MFDWKNDFSVGIEEIDEQHKRLFAIGKQIYELLNNYNDQDNFNSISSLIGEMSDYTAYHFQTEEELFEKYNYPEAQKHIAEHQEFIDYLQSLDLSQINGNHKEATMDLLKFISRWIFRHINSTDFRYSDFLIKAIKEN